MVGSFLAPKWPIQVPFCRMYHQKSTFSLILAPFLSEAAEASQCYFFENWLMKLKCPILLKPLDTMIQENYWSFYPSEPFRITRFTMRHPVYWKTAILMHFVTLKNVLVREKRTYVKKWCNLLNSFLLVVLLAIPFFINYPVLDLFHWFSKYFLHLKHKHG